MNAGYSVISFIIWIIVIYATVKVAISKGRSGILWGILAVLFWIIALVVVAVLPSRAGGY